MDKNDWYGRFVDSMVKLNKRPENDMNDRLLLGALGLAGETGEVVEHIKKAIMHDKYLDREALVKELGDVFWYWTLLRITLGVSEWEIKDRNRTKLEKRYGVQRVQEDDGRTE